MARTYTNTPEPRKVLEADTIRGYSRETVEEALQGGGGEEWTPKFTVHFNPQTMKLEETMAEIQAFNPILHDRVAVVLNDNIFAYTTVLSADYSGATLIKIYFGTDLFAPNVKQFVSLNSGKYELAYFNTTLNETLTPRVFDWNGTTLNLTEYDSAIIMSLSAL